ncbi:hypothetical protein Lal_00038938 [Lupinus albus]|uniref:Putative glutaredoxin-like, plant II, thioredoxin-like protein n=1 Tax=Lupinus albus TaxID=3870 RepID=A0A6A4NWI1_LUPAL|nr:putative glutaredoxin-like, plant II, thioredoxin-like protein [Lupinus albus]KAF1882292.1 hypothetical protein Lal_00038938 [Lupinus albus]
MHQAIPYAYRTTVTPTTRDHYITGGMNLNPSNTVIKLVSQNAVIIIGQRGCCMCHVVQRLLQSLGVNPPVHEIDEHHETAIVTACLLSHVGKGGGTMQFPMVFVGGKLFGGLEKIIATHISGELVPILKDAGALWL